MTNNIGDEQQKKREYISKRDCQKKNVTELFVVINKERFTRNM